MRRVVIRVSLMLAILTAAYLGLLRREAVSGTRPARSPEDALERFQDAIRARDYELAAAYCEGDYAEQLRRAGPAARLIGKSIDSLRSNIEQEGPPSDHVRRLIDLLEPFPHEVRVYDLRRFSADRACVVLMEESGARLKIDGSFEGWQIDWRLIRPLTRGLPPYIELRCVGMGDTACWKLFFPVTPELRKCVCFLEANAATIARALDRVKDTLERDATTRADLEHELRSELEQACR